jgi:F/Y-rich N-terminus/PHD-like zinc-binding domain/PHD-finger
LIRQKFVEADEAKKKEAERIQLDESTEKKDLVAGSQAARITLPKLRDRTPDQASCVPCAEISLKTFDAFFCSWMEACFICGSSGASDTLLFCVDCGEAFHSFCANAPVHSMTESSVAGWRCPNCKICEISGDVPQDETRMLFCEMCDRGFSLDLLDPPLNTVPNGLWICGQCVDCGSCGRKGSESASLKHWSPDPEKCYRCGSCAAVIGYSPSDASCTICLAAFRTYSASADRCDDCRRKFGSKKKRAPPSVIISRPLCGWRDLVQVTSPETLWIDPRECCLCHLKGDDDAGFADSDGNPDEPRMGRLLPVTEGHWVHSLCALWSSETWESSEDGLIHAVEKAKSRGSKLKCFGCGRNGATIGCNKGNCPFNYHLPCAKVAGAVFTSSQQVFCATHRSFATGVLLREGCEFMKTLMTSTEEKKGSDVLGIGVDLCPRLGALVVHSLGTIDTIHDGFHTEDYITPPGYVATRIFWSAKQARTRTVYVLRVERSDKNKAIFSILPGDDPDRKIVAASALQAYASLMDRVRKMNAEHFSHGDEFSVLPMNRRTRRKTFGLNGAQVRAAARVL